MKKERKFQEKSDFGMKNKGLKFQFRRGPGFKKAALWLCSVCLGLGALIFALSHNPSWLILCASLTASTLYFLHRKTLAYVYWDKDNPSEMNWDDLILPVRWQNFTWHYDMEQSHGRLRAFGKRGEQTLLIEQRVPIADGKAFAHLPPSPKFDPQTTWHYLAFGENFLGLIAVTEPSFLVILSTNKK